MPFRSNLCRWVQLPTSSSQRRCQTEQGGLPLAGAGAGSAPGFRVPRRARRSLDSAKNLSRLDTCPYVRFWTFDQGSSRGTKDRGALVRLVPGQRSAGRARGDPYRARRAQRAGFAAHATAAGGGISPRRPIRTVAPKPHDAVPGARQSLDPGREPDLAGPVRHDAGFPGLLPGVRPRIRRPCAKQQVAGAAARAAGAAGHASGRRRQDQVVPVRAVDSGTLGGVALAVPDRMHGADRAGARRHADRRRADDHRAGVPARAAAAIDECGQPRSAARAVGRRSTLRMVRAAATEPRGADGDQLLRRSGRACRAAPAHAAAARRTRPVPGHAPAARGADAERHHARAEGAP